MEQDALRDTPWRALRERLMPPPLYLAVRARRAWRKALRRHEPELRLLDVLVPRGRPAIDVGANRGIYTYFLARLAPRVYAYEPNPALARHLRAAVGQNVIVRETALSDREGAAPLQVPLSPGGYARANIGSLETVTGRAVSVNVAVRPLDGEDVGDPGFIKIDVEGHESKVIAGARALLVRSKPTLVVEILDLDPTPLAHPVVRMLAGLGYVPLVIRGGRLQHAARADPDAPGRNVIFLPA